MTQQADETRIARPGPCVIVVFGASGDLTKRLLVPPMYNLGAHELLPENFAVIGVAIDEMDSAAFREQLSRGVRDTADTNIDATVRPLAITCTTRPSRRHSSGTLSSSSPRPG